MGKQLERYIKMRTKRKIVHVVEMGYFNWDLTEKKWVAWAKYISSSRRCLHSARLARKDFESIRHESPCFRHARWLTYKNDRLVRVKVIGDMSHPIHPVLDFDHSCLNPVGTWWIALGNLMSKVA